MFTHSVAFACAYHKDKCRAMILHGQKAIFNATLYMNGSTQKSASMFSLVCCDENANSKRKGKTWCDEIPSNGI